MTSTQNDPWAAAGAGPAGNGGAPAEQASQLAGSMAGGESGGSQLFGGGSVAPSLLNKTHGLNVERTGICTKAPYDRQAVDYNEKTPKFWPDSGVNEKGKKGPTALPVDPTTGKRNRPVLDTLIELDTEYVMDAAEAAAVGREEPFEGTERVLALSGAALKAFKDAIVDANKRGVRIATEEDIVGKRITAKRVGQKPNPGGNPSWITAFRIDNA